MRPWRSVVLRVRCSRSHLLNDRGFIFDPMQMLPGLLTRTTDELYAALSHLHQLNVLSKTEQLIEHFWRHPRRRLRASGQFIEQRLGEQLSADPGSNAVGLGSLGSTRS